MLSDGDTIDMSSIDESILFKKFTTASMPTPLPELIVTSSRDENSALKIKLDIF